MSDFRNNFFIAKNGVRSNGAKVLSKPPSEEKPVPVLNGSNSLPHSSLNNNNITPTPNSKPAKKQSDGFFKTLLSLLKKNKKPHEDHRKSIQPIGNGEHHGKLGSNGNDEKVYHPPEFKLQTRMKDPKQHVAISTTTANAVLDPKVVEVLTNSTQILFLFPFRASPSST